MATQRIVLYRKEPRITQAVTARKRLGPNTVKFPYPCPLIKFRFHLTVDILALGHNASHYEGVLGALIR